MSDKAERLESMAVDIDTRLLELWNIVMEPNSVVVAAFEQNEALRGVVGDIIRTAYTRGYIDALEEEKAGRRSELHRTHGYKPA